VTLLLYLIALATVVSTAHISGYETFLRTMTLENGFFETLSVILLFSISLYGITCAIRSREQLSKIAFIFTIGFALVAFLAGMEEISWGQQLFHFQSGEFFLKENLQQETNLHNLIPATIFSGVIYFSIYSFFIFIPLFYKIFNTELKPYRLLGYFDINPHIILVTLFASSFQMFFYHHIGSWTDMITFFIALMLFGYYMWSYPSTLWLKLHFAFILVATTLSLWSHEVYRFKNMQYEIRESFVVLASLLLFIELVNKEKKATKNPSTPQS
jgi:hypothetical protein